MSDDIHWEQVYDLVNDMEYKLECIHTELQAERAFHKVYAAAAGLVFLYGMVYGAWLCPK